MFLKIRTVNATTMPNVLVNPCLSGAEIALIVLKNRNSNYSYVTGLLQSMFSNFAVTPENKWCSRLQCVVDLFID